MELIYFFEFVDIFDEFLSEVSREMLASKWLKSVPFRGQ